MLKRLVASVLLTSLLACTTLRPLADYEQYVRTSQRSQLIVTPKDSKPLRLDGPRFVNDTLVGFVEGRYREFAPGELSAVQAQQPARGRTALLVGAVLTLGAVLIATLAGSGSPSTPPNPEQPATVTIP
jgi:hypothetical protein